MVFTHFIHVVCICWGFPGGAVVNNPLANAGEAGDSGSIPGSGRSSGEGNDNPLEYSCLENSMDRGTWWAIQSMVLQRVRNTLANLHQGIWNVLLF